MVIKKKSNDCRFFLFGDKFTNVTGFGECLNFENCITLAIWLHLIGKTPSYLKNSLYLAPSKHSKLLQNLIRPPALSVPDYTWSFHP